MYNLDENEFPCAMRLKARSVLKTAAGLFNPVIKVSMGKCFHHGDDWGTLLSKIPNRVSTGVLPEGSEG